MDYAFDIQNATLAEIRQLINRTELENVSVLGTSSFVGDGATTRWYIAPPGYYIDPGSVAILVDGIAAGFTIDEATGIVTMTDTPPDGAEGESTFTARQFSDYQVDAAINAAVGMLFPAIWVAGEELVSSDGESYEYEMPDTVEVVTSVDYRRSPSDGWSRQSRSRRFSIDRRGAGLVVRFYNQPSPGELRFHTVERPRPFTYEDQQLTSLGLPARAIDPIISGAVYRLLMDKAALRIRTDVAVATMGTGTIFPSMMSQIAKDYLMRFQFQMSGAKMRPWISR